MLLSDCSVPCHCCYRYPPFEPKVIYIHLGLMVVCGVCMGFNMARRPAALFHCGQLLFLAYSTYVNEKLKYSQWLKVSIACIEISGNKGKLDTRFLFDLYKYKQNLATDVNNHFIALIHPIQWTIAYPVGADRPAKRQKKTSCVSTG